jgi:hypothetical protein
VARSGQEVLFVDATGGFSVSRLAQLAQQEAATAEAQRRALESVCCVKAFDVHEALRLLDGLLRGGGGSFAARPRPALLVFDSVSALLSPLLTTKHSQGHALMLSLAGALRALADEHNVAVLVRAAAHCCTDGLSIPPLLLRQLTNHTVSGRDGEEGSLKPALGETWKSQRACSAARAAVSTVAPDASLCAAHLRLQLSAGPFSGVEGRQVNSAMVTLGRGRGRSCSYTVAASGLMPA